MVFFTFDITDMKAVYHIILIKRVLIGLLLCIGNLFAAKGEEYSFMPRAIEDAPVLDKIETSDLLYIKGSGAVDITNTLTVSDEDSRNLWLAIVKIAEGYVVSEDILTFKNKDKISHDWNPATGELILTGRSSVANYQSALRSIKYENKNSLSPSKVSRVVTFRVKDAFQNSNIVSRKIIIQSTNAAPILINLETSPLVYCKNSPSVPVTSTIRISDPDNFRLTDAKVRISAGYSAGEILRFTDQNGITGTWNNTAGILTLSGEAPISSYQEALRSITYENSHAAVRDTNTIVSFTVSDGTNLSDEVKRRIIVNGRVSAVLSGSGSFCGSVLNAPLSLDLSGMSPWTVTLIRNNKTDLNYDNITTDPFKFTVSQEGTYRLKSISDAHCTGDTIGSGYVTITAKPKPTAIISGNNTICQGETAELLVVLTGKAPWSITWLKNGQNQTRVENIMTDHYTLPVTADGIYTLSGVEDAFCHGTVSGSAVISVIQVPDVTITGLASTYNKNSSEWILLTGTPAGGVFSGPGLIPYDNKWYFLPFLPPVGTHHIVYAYAASPGMCFGYDTAIVRVLK